MKRIISLLLAGVILCGSMPRVDHANILAFEEQQSQAGPWLVVFVIGCVAAGAYGLYRIWVATKDPSPNGTYYWALETSTDHVNWTSVATNGLRMTRDRAWDAFEVYMGDAGKFYRLRMVQFLDPAGTNTFLQSQLVTGSIDPDVRIIPQPAQ